jgi:hypothetical protein
MKKWSFSNEIIFVESKQRLPLEAEAILLSVEREDHGHGFGNGA